MKNKQYDSWISYPAGNIKAKLKNLPEGFTPWKMNGWNLTIHPKGKGKESEPNNHFQVLC